MDSQTLPRSSGVRTNAAGRWSYFACAILSASIDAACSKANCDYDSPSCGEGRVCAFVEPGKSRCVQYVDAALDLQPPFKPGHQFWCAQGGRSASGRTHSFQGDLFAMDLPSVSSGEVEVIAPVAGTAYTFDGCEERDPGPTAHNDSRCGLGYGNHVKIWDGTNIYLFGHLARVRVQPGPVQREQVLGVMGCSGAAGHRHVHLTVTRPLPGEDVDKILGTPGWKGQMPVRYRFVAKEEAGGATVTAQPDVVVGCNDERVRATMLMR